MASKPIVAGTDGSEESLQAVGWAAREAALRGAPLRIVATAGLLPRMRPHTSAGEYETVTDVLVEDRDRALAMAAERAAKAAAGVLIDTRALTGLSARADLVVIGRRPGAPGPGSVRHALLNHAHGPVAVVPS